MHREAGQRDLPLAGELKAMSRFARLPLVDISESMTLLGERVTILVGPQAFARAQEDAGPQLIWLDAGLFRFGSIDVRLATPSECPDP